jgi:hypothetical protein
MRCKSCGYLWTVSFKNFEIGASEEAKLSSQQLQPIVMSAKRLESA